MKKTLLALQTIELLDKKLTLSTQIISLLGYIQAEVERRIKKERSKIKEAKETKAILLRRFKIKVVTPERSKQ